MRAFFKIGRAKQAFTGVLSIIAVTLLLLSCNEDAGFLGKDLLPEGDNINSYSDTVTVIQAWTVTSKPVITGYNGQLILGSRYDSIFGLTEADFMLPLFAVSPKDPGENISVDSVILELIIDRHFGDSLTSHTLRIYELTDTLTLDSAYLSDFVPDGHYRAEEIASKTFVGYTDTLKIKITDPVFSNKFITSPRETFKYDSLFRNVYKGLYVSTDRVAKDGSLLFVDSLLNSSAIYLYYQNDSSRTSINPNLTYKMGFTYAAAKVNMFKNEYDGYRAGHSINNPESSDTLLFLAAMGSMDVRLTIPDLDRLKNRAGKIVVNKAELILPVEKSLSVTTNMFPPKLLLWTVDGAGEYDYLYDYRIDPTQNKTIFNGVYEYFKKGQYIFNISRQVQAYIDGDENVDSLEFILRPTLSSQSAYRTILKGPGAFSDPMKLVIVYTEL